MRKAVRSGLAEEVIMSHAHNILYADYSGITFPHDIGSSLIMKIREKSIKYFHILILSPKGSKVGFNCFV